MKPAEDQSLSIMTYFFSVRGALVLEAGSADATVATASKGDTNWRSFIVSDWGVNSAR